MNHLSLFTGAGGGEYAAHLLGWHTVAYVERDEYCQRVIKQRQDDGIFNKAPIFGDVREFNGRPWRGRIDIISGGFPCTPFSVAGKGLAADDERNMWPEMCRVVREVEPIFVFMENSPAILDSRGGRYAGVVLEQLAALGFDATWCVLGADAVGAPHDRHRWWCLASHPERYRLRAQQEQERGSEGRTFAPDDGKDGTAPDDNCRRKQKQEEERNEARRRTRHSARKTNAHTSGSRLERRGVSGRASTQVAASCGDSWWTTQPSVVCVVHGLANRRDRIKALGNGQVPAVAALAFMALLERLLSAWNA